MKISILIPCYNEELTIEKCILSCLFQTRPADEVIIVNDSSSDNTLKILKKFSLWPSIKIVTTPNNMGNKSYAQEYGLKFVTGDVFVTTDGDTILHKDFLSFIEKDMENSKMIAVAGYVKSLKYNWITACRAIDYIVSQDIDKVAQNYMNAVFVIPGAAGAFRTEVFKNKISFAHDTLTEDLDFTYCLHKMGYDIGYNRNAICYTQDPTTLKSYIKQTRRWLGGGWQNLSKHLNNLPTKPGMILELVFMYLEGLIFSSLAFLMPFINLFLAVYLLIIYSALVFILTIYASIKEKRLDLSFALPCYIFLKYVNAYIFLEQFFKEFVFKRKDLVWQKPERVKNR